MHHATKELVLDPAAKMLVVLSVLLMVGACSQESPPNAADATRREATTPTTSEFERKEAALIYMANKCPFRVGDSREACIAIINNSNENGWEWYPALSERPDGGFSPTILWSSVIEIPIWGRFTYKFSSGTVLEIIGQLNLRFVDDDLVEVTFQEGAPGLLLGMKRIIEPSAMSGEFGP